MHFLDSVTCWDEIVEIWECTTIVRTKTNLTKKQFNP